MSPWSTRLFLYITLSLGLSLTIFPYNTSRVGYIETETVTLEKPNMLSLTTIKSQFPYVGEANQLLDITESALNPDDYPDLWRAFINLGDDWLIESADINEWQKYLPKINKNRPENQLVIFRENLVFCSSNNDSLKLRHIGKYNPNIKTLSKQDLSGYPKIFEAINHELEVSSIIISKAQWDSMVEQYLNPVIDSQVFSYEGIYYGPQMDTDIKYFEEDDEVKNLKYLINVFGITFLVISFAYIYKLYFGKGGDSLKSIKHSVLYDVIALVFITPAAYLMINLAFAIFLMVEPYITSIFLLYIGAFFFLIGVPLLSSTICRLEKKSIK